MIKSFLVGCLIGLVVLTHQDAKATQHRQALAASWSDADAYYSANGYEGRNLTIVMPYAERQKACNRWFEVTLPDRALSQHLRAEGFKTVSCGQEQEPLR